MFNLSAARFSMSEDPRGFAMTVPRRTRDLFHAILLLILLGSATCTVFLTLTLGSVDPERSQFVEHVLATGGSSTANSLHRR
jgi:hypothetical protein